MVNLCQDCTYELIEWGAPAYQFFKTVLKNYEDKKFIIFDEKDVLHVPIKVIVNFLESKNLLITLDIGTSNILVKINKKSIYYHKEQDFYCLRSSKDHFSKKGLFKIA